MKIMLDQTDSPKIKFFKKLKIKRCARAYQINVNKK